MLWVKMIRPATLPAALVPVSIALLLAAQIMTLIWPIAIVTLLTATAIQILSNLVNDYYDFKKGADGEGRLGPVRPISAGLISQKQLKIAIYITLLGVIVGGAYLIAMGGWPIILIGISAILFAWLYSATAFSLSALGIADLFVLLYFGPVATLGTYYLQTGAFSTQALWYGIGTGTISMAILTVNNIRDREQDALHHKKTIVVRLGHSFACCYYALLLCFPFLPLLFLPNALWSVIYLLAAIALYYAFLKAQGRGYNKILLYPSLLNVLYFCTILLGYYVA